MTTIAQVQESLKELWPLLIGNSHPSAVAVQGSIARRAADARSDIDLVCVYPDRCASDGAPTGPVEDPARRVWELRRIHLDELDVESWRPGRRYVYVWETSPLWDPSGHFERIAKLARPTRDEIVSRIAYCIYKLHARDVVYAERSASWRGISADGVDRWHKKGDLYSAHMRLNQAHELLVELVYLVNQRIRPSPKAVYSILPTLPWFPKSVETGLQTFCMVGTLSLDSYEDRRRAGAELVRILVDEATSRGLTEPDIGSTYRRFHSRAAEDQDASYAGGDRLGRGS